MLNKEIPFRPKLEGNFRVRFYNAASKITDKTQLTDIEKIIKEEISWVEKSCLYNINQRRKYRAVWLLFRDLMHASWKACFRSGALYMSLPMLGTDEMHIKSSSEAKNLLRSWMSESRRERLVKSAEFIQRMEKPNALHYCIRDLIADGNELANRIEQVHNGTRDVKDAIKPYLQLVRGDEKDTFTGIKLSDIWRYFRLTWSTPYESTPGRTLQYLIRDAAHPLHAVMGIASLENCAVQITCRDNYIGWNQKAFIENILKLANDTAKEEFKWLLSYLEDGIRGIDYSKLCTVNTIESPTQEEISRLLKYANDAELNRQELLRHAANSGYEKREKSELGSISKETEKALYQHKRAEQLARLLFAKMNILKIYTANNFYDIWKDFCNSEIGNSVIRTALLAQKSKHIGSSLLELNTCGAIPPYNELLGGKLVALLAISPQVVHDYKEKYSNRASMIASRLKGSAVCRPADLVYIGTTSLYYVGSSQYNRLKIPGELFGSSYNVDWKRLGMTIGFGTMHISKATTLSLTEATSNGYKRINHVFGEGASPKMRLLNMAIRELLESSNDDLKDFGKHAMSRIVYGACLAKNTKEYLLGKDRHINYYADMSSYEAGTQKIIDFWSSRWLKSRLNYLPIYQRIRNFDKETLIVGNQINTDEEWNFLKLEEELPMPTNTTNVSGLQFVRDFYRGKSAYADYMNPDFLFRIHLKTKLDDAIINAAKKGKDIVLTGNPGDGKTHIIRILKDQLENIGKVKIELDASTLSNEEIYERWKKAHEGGCIFVIAINAAILYSVFKKHEDFNPVKDAYTQMCNAVVFHEENVDTTRVIVFDLSKREILTKDIIKEAISKLTDKENYDECETCRFKNNCDVHKHIRLLNDPLFQERLYVVLQRTSLFGYHATVRDLQSFIAYLIFGDRTCSQLVKTTENDAYDIVNLIYSGKGKIFTAISKAFDPINISHPIWDEKLLTNKIESSSWVGNYGNPTEAISAESLDLFNLRKRQFFFFNKHGNEFLNILDDNAENFSQFLKEESNSTIIKRLINMLNSFFGQTQGSSTNLQIWSGHRFNNDPRKILISLCSKRKNDFSIGRPTLLASMQDGIDTSQNYLRLEKKNSKNIFLKIDFNIYLLLKEAQRGVPVLFMDSDNVRKIWRFIEQLQSYEEYIYKDETEISLMDVQNKKTIKVTIDRDDHKYTVIENKIRYGEY